MKAGPVALTIVLVSSLNGFATSSAWATGLHRCTTITLQLPGCKPAPTPIKAGGSIHVTVEGEFCELAPDPKDDVCYSYHVPADMKLELEVQDPATSNWTKVSAATVTQLDDCDGVARFRVDAAFEPNRDYRIGDDHYGCSLTFTTGDAEEPDDTSSGCSTSGRPGPGDASTPALALLALLVLARRGHTVE